MGSKGSPTGFTEEEAHAEPGASCHGEVVCTGISPELLESQVEGPGLFAANMLVLCQLQRPQFRSSMLRAGTKDSSLGDRRLH